MINAIERISNLIEYENLVPMKKWSERYDAGKSHKSSYIINLIRQIKNVLKIISGNDIVAMLKDVLSKEEIDDLSEPYKKALEGISEYCNRMDKRDRHHIIRPIKSAKISRSNLKKLGYVIGTPLWRSCFNNNNRSKGGRPLLSLEKRQLIKSYLEANSSVASNRMIKIKGPESMNYVNKEPARYLNDNRSKLYTDFRMSLPLNSEPISIKSFYKYSNITNEYKKPHRLTDLCDYCEKYREIKKRVSVFLSQNQNNTHLGDTSVESILKYLEKKIIDETRNLHNNDDINRKETNNELLYNDLQLIEFIDFHKMAASYQREAYKDHMTNKNNILKDKLLIDFDFKQKISIGLSPRQASAEFRNQKLCTCLGFGIYYLEVNNLKSINFDLIWMDEAQTGKSVVRGFRLLREQEFFKKIDLKSYIIWADTGTHFRNNELLSYLFKDLAELEIEVNLNFFGEKHGKNMRDTHFSRIAQFVRDESYVKKLETCQDVVDAIHKRQEIANQNKKNPCNPNRKQREKELDYLTVKNQKKSTDIEITYAMVVDYDNILKNVINNIESEKESEEINIEESKRKIMRKDEITAPQIKITDLDCYYNLRTTKDNFQIIKSSIFSNKNEPLISISKNSNTSNSISYGVPFEKVEVKPIGFTKLQERKAKIEIMQHNISKNNIIPDFSNLLQERLPTSSLKKTQNENCQEAISIPINYLLNKIKHPSQTVIREELNKHGFPKTSTTIVNGIKRLLNTEEQARQLADHYISKHGLTEPSPQELIKPFKI